MVGRAQAVQTTLGGRVIVDEGGKKKRPGRQNGESRVPSTASQQNDQKQGNEVVVDCGRLPRKTKEAQKLSYVATSL